MKHSKGRRNRPLTNIVARQLSGEHEEVLIRRQNVELSMTTHLQTDMMATITRWKFNNARKAAMSRLLFRSVLILLASRVGVGYCDERLEGVACRSVHLQYRAPAGTAFYNEVTVDKSAEGTYFCVCGFNQGYYGLQELKGGKKVFIFSVWDPGKQDNPNAVADDQRVKLLYQDEAVRVGRFGNEGTGGQSFFDYDWKVGDTYRFLVTAMVNGQRTEFTGWFLLHETRQWKKLITFSTLTGGKPLAGYYSFVEDFRRNRVSTQQVREARFGNGWVRDEQGQWHAVSAARFTADNNPVLNINAGQRNARFFLVTGGDTKNDATPLKEMIEIAANAQLPAPADLPKE
jgi:hypothetical protein